MKKTICLLLAASLLSLNVLAAPTATAQGETPLMGSVTLLNAAGQMVGEINPQGLLFMGTSAGEVASLRVSPLHTANTRTTSYRLMTGTQPAVLEVFGPAGQRVLLSIPNLKSVSWIGASGHSSAMNVR